MNINLQLPPKAVSRLADEADQYGMTVAELVADLTLVWIRRIPEGAADPIVARWRKGWTDKQIAADLDLTNLRVANVRRKYGLPANSLRHTGKQIRRAG